jgi:hypothetical protein
MMNPRLSDFTESQLRMMLRSMIYQRVEIEKHVINLKSSAYYEKMFEKDILQFETEIEESIQVETQIAYEITKAQSALLVMSN